MVIVVTPLIRHLVFVLLTSSPLRRARSAGVFAQVFVRRDVRQLSERDVGGGADETGAGGRPRSAREVCASRSRVAGDEVSTPARLTTTARSSVRRAFPAGFQEDAALFAAVWRWGCEAAHHGGQTPFLDVRFDEDEAHLPEIDVHRARTVGADGGEEVLRLQPVCDVVQLFPVTSEEDGPHARPISDPYDIPLHVLRSVTGGSERLIEASVAVGRIRYGGFVPTSKNVNKRKPLLRLEILPGNLKRGYGLVVRPMLTRVDSGLS